MMKWAMLIGLALIVVFAGQLFETEVVKRDLRIKELVKENSTLKRKVKERKNVETVRREFDPVTGALIAETVIKDKSETDTDENVSTDRTIDREEHLKEKIGKRYRSILALGISPISGQRVGFLYGVRLLGPVGVFTSGELDVPSLIQLEPEGSLMLGIMLWR